MATCVRAQAQTSWHRFRRLTERLLRRGGPSVVLSVVLFTGTLAPFAQAGVGLPATSAFAADTRVGHGKNTFHPQPDRGRSFQYLPGLTHRETQTLTASPVHRQSGVTMAPADLPLDPGHDARLLGSDGRLEVNVPAGALTPATLTQAGGPVHLHVTQVAGPSGSTNSGQVSLGTYKYELLGPHGPVGGGLAKPITLTLHYAPWIGAGFDLANTTLILNGDAPTSALVGPDGQIPAGLQPSYVRATLDRTHQTLTAAFQLTATSSSGGSSSTGTWNTNSPVAQWTKPADTSVDLNAGSLAYAYPLDLPPGPGGLTPQLQLAYSSGAVNEAHNPQAAAGWTGEGWDLALGAITWSELNVSSGCTILTCTTQCITNGTCATWQNEWSLSDAYGTSADLIPPDTTVSTYYDDTTNPTPTATDYIWHTARESRIKVVSYNHANANYPSTALQPPCWRVWLTNGIMEEFGCTRDSLQYYVSENKSMASYTTYLPYRWDLDMIVDPNGNQIHITYTPTRVVSPAGGSFPMEAVPTSITYDSPTCHSTTTMCTGNSWQPLVQIALASATAPSHLYPSGQASCPTWTWSKYVVVGTSSGVTMRCDDVHDLSGSGGLGAPQLQARSVLNDVQIQVTTNGATPTWNALRDYRLSYSQAASSTISKDPNTGLPESVAGALLLTQIQQVGDDGSTTLPPLTMSYTPETEYYLDSQFSPTPSTGNCGPAWNASQCKLWSQTYNTSYLSELDNGRGWSETYTWADARNNTHGVLNGMTLEDPLACTNATATQQATFPCSQADDENWSRIIVTQRKASVQCVAANGSGCGAGGSSTLTSTWSYLYTLTDLVAYECMPGCTVGMHWGNMNDGDKLDFYNPQFMGFATATVTNPDGSRQLFKFKTTMGYGVWGSSVICVAYFPCSVSPWSDPRNVLHGRLYEEDDYDTNGTTLLRQQTDTYAVACPPAGVTASAHAHYTGQLTAELDQIGDPIVDCEIDTTQQDVYQLDGGASSTAPHLSTAYQYYRDSSGHLIQLNTVPTSNDGGALGSPTTYIDYTGYAWNDAVTVTSTSANGTHILELPAYRTVTYGSGNTRLACVLRGYDGHAATTGASANITKRLLTSENHYATQCGNPANNWTYTGLVQTTATYDNSGNLLATRDPDANAGVGGHTNATGCTFNSVAYSACATWDSSPNYQTHVTQVTNALNQHTSLGYTGTGGAAASNGWGQWVTGLTDGNNQTTSFSYDALGRLTATTLPGEGTGLTTTQDAYPVSCPTTGAAEPCVALATTQRLDSSTTVTSATYYDGWGRTVETVTPAPTSGSSCQFSVRYTLYDPAGRTTFQSDPYFVILRSNCPSGTNPPPYFAPDTTQPGTGYTYDGLGRTLTTTDPLAAVTSTIYTQGQPQGANVSDGTYYEQATTTDANSHKHALLTDALGRKTYAETFSGNGGSVAYALYGTSASVYDYLGDVTSVTGPNAGTAGLSTSAQSTASYDVMGRRTGLTDADLGTGWTYAYDQDGNLTQSVDPRGGTSGTVYAGYDGLNRQLWRNTSNSPTGAYVNYTYDSTAGGNHGVGRLTGETFSNHLPSLGNGSYGYIYDERGQRTGLSDVLDGTTYPFTFAYNDAGMPTSTTYSDNEVATFGYTVQGWLQSLTTTPNGGQATTLLSNLSYGGVGGAAAHPTSASVGNGTYSFSANYDNDLRLGDVNLTHSGTTVFDQSRSFDAVSNVASATTTLAAGTDNQAFCYDEQNRLTWASSANGTPPCGGTLTAGTLSSAQYTQTFAYDALNRLTNVSGTTLSYGPGMQAGSNPAPLHGVVSLSTGATYSYDTAGDRSNPGSLRGATYDVERRLSSWSTSSGSSGYELYDGEGQRIAHQTTVSGTTTTTYYVGGLEEVTGSTLTKYYDVGQNLPLIVKVGSTLSYLARDGLGSIDEALDGNGNATAQQLFAPYGNVRYSSNGSMPTTKGFTGQRADSVSSLDYYGARYYDPATDQFANADTASGAGVGLNRLGYVAGNPETYTDPSGHRVACPAPSGCGGGGGTPPPPPPPCTGNNCRDSHGKCINYETCDRDKAAAGRRLTDQYHHDFLIGGALVLIGNLARLWLDKDSPVRELEDLINLALLVESLLPTLAADLFGSGSIEAQLAFEAAKAANSIVAVLRAAEGAINGLLGFAGGFVGPLLDASGFFIDVVQGPIGMVASEVARLFGSAVLNMGIAYGFSLLNASMDEQQQIETIAGETVPQWCQNTPGACGTTTLTS